LTTEDARISPPRACAAIRGDDDVLAGAVSAGERAAREVAGAER
jgi:hypothetical protein